MSKTFEVWMLDSDFNKICKIASFSGEDAAVKANHCCIECSYKDIQHNYNYFAIN